MNPRKYLFTVILMLIPCLLAGNMVQADDCDEARKWYDEGDALRDDSETEASYYKRAIELCPDYFEAHNKLGEVYKNWEEYELAIKEFEQAIRAPLFAEAHNNLGEIFRMQGRYDLAAQQFREAVRIKPDFLEAQNNLKYVEKRLGKFDHVIEEPPEPTPRAVFTRIPGMTLPKGSFLVDLQYKFWRQEAALKTPELDDRRDPFGPSERVTDVQVLILGIRYGLTNDFTIGLIPKWFSKKTRVTVPFWGIDAEPEVSGLGDTVLLTKYRLWGRRKTHVSAFGLLGIPTGDEDALGESQGVVRNIPLGSGGYDFSPGLALTTVKDPLTIHANLSYVFTNGRVSGDQFHADLALVFPRYHNLVAGLELNYRWADSNIREQFYQRQWGLNPPPDTGRAPGPVTETFTFEEDGGHTLMLSLGLQAFITKGFRAEIGFQVPVIRPGDGWVEEVVLHAGLTKYFF
jgi:hypothetical protein